MSDKIMASNSSSSVKSEIQFHGSRTAFFVLVGFIALCGAFINLDPVSTNQAAQEYGKETLAILYGKILLSFPDKDAFPFVAGGFAIIVVLLHKAALLRNRKDTVSLCLLSAFLSFSLIAGFALENYDDTTYLLDGGIQAFKTIWKFLSVSFISYSIFTCLFHLLDNIRKQERKDGELPLAFARKHPLLVPAVALMVAWLPFLIGTFPGLFMGDTGGQISQWFNLPNYTSSYLNLIDDSVLLNAHHPIAHTALMGTCVQLGSVLFDSYNAGYFLYTLIQYVIVAMTIAYGMHFLKKIGVSFKIRLVSFAFCAFIPIFPQYAVLGTKDTIFSCCTLLIFIMLYKMLDEKEPMKVSDWVILSVSSLGFVFFRNGSIVLLSLVFAAIFLLRTRYRKQVGSAFVSILIAFSMVSYVIMPSMSITPGSKRELLSIPIQQVSRCIVLHTSEITEQDRQIINNVLKYDSILKNYNPSNADPVKNTFNESATSEELSSFVATWLHFFMKYPQTCVEATLANYYGYFYPSKEDTVAYDIAWSKEKMSETHEEFFDFQTIDNSFSSSIGEAVSLYLDLWQRIPLLSVLTTAAFYSWLILTTAIFTAKRRGVHSVPYFFLLLVLFVGFIGPMNASHYIRYIVPIILASPFFVSALFANESQKTKESGESV